MKTFEWELSEVSAVPQGVALSIGVFDGVHLGHQELIRRIRDNGHGAQSIIITFRDHPLRVLQPQAFPGNIMPMDYKLHRLEALGIDGVLLIDFSMEFSKLSGAEFIGRIYRLFRPQLVVLGKDFRCGHKNDTDATAVEELLSHQRVQVDVVEPIADDGYRVSSTRIRAAIQNGDFHTARRLLGVEYFVSLTGTSAGLTADSYAVSVGSLKQVVPLHGEFQVTMYDGSPYSLNGTSSGTGGTVENPRRLSVRIRIADGVLSWPESAGPDFTHIRFDRSLGERENAISDSCAATE
ncbi:MAG TPA: FAD synthetase family protein [Spirochaetia bacterium]|nr:FAD synthetase family protein [Spirochaetia bacterium]